MSKLQSAQNEHVWAPLGSNFEKNTDSLLELSFSLIGGHEKCQFFEDPFTAPIYFLLQKPKS